MDETGQWWYVPADPNRHRTRCKVKLCERCGDEFLVSTFQYRKRKFCGRSCSGFAASAGGKRKGSKASRWQGGRKKNDKGYVQVYMPDHPAASSGGNGGIYVLEHRLVMEKHLGRYLHPDEIVHHLNGIKDDNRIENLELRSRSAHALEHRPSFAPPHCPTCTCGGHP